MADPQGRGGGLVPLSTVATAKPAAPGGGAARRGGGPPAGPRLYGGPSSRRKGRRPRLRSSVKTIRVSAA